MGTLAFLKRRAIGSEKQALTKTSLTGNLKIDSSEGSSTLF